jgi:hypothetical protein
MKSWVTLVLLKINLTLFTTHYNLERNEMDKWIIWTWVQFPNYLEKKKFVPLCAKLIWVLETINTNDTYLYIN